MDTELNALYNDIPVAWVILMAGLICVLFAVLFIFSRPRLKHYSLTSKPNLFSAKQQHFLSSLRLSVAGKYMVYGKTYLKDIVISSGPSDKVNSFMEEINDLSVDFVITQKDGTSLLAAIDLTGDKKEPARSEKLKAAVLKKVGIPLMRFKACDNYSTTNMSLVIEDRLETQGKKQSMEQKVA